MRIENSTRVVWDQIESRALAGNPLGDPAARRLPVILPPGYGDNPARRYPTLYGLAAYPSRGAMLLNDDPWRPNLQQRLERLYAAGMPHAIVVLPDCLTGFGGSQYINSSATGCYEDYLTQEIVPYIDRVYATVAGPEGRGVFGHSSGGYGALVTAMRHPDLFGAVACHSGDMAFDLCYMPDFPKAANAINRAGGLDAWWQAFAARGEQDRLDLTTLGVLAMAACYSPDPAAPLGLALPFNLETCELREEIWARWLAWDPVRMAETCADALRSLRLLFFDCGARDEYNLNFGARRLARRLRDLGIAHEYAEFDDGHTNVRYRLDVSLPKLAGALVGSSQ